MTNKPRLVVACLMLAGGPAGCGNRTPSPEATTPGSGPPGPVGGRVEVTPTGESVRPSPQPGGNPDPIPDAVTALGSSDAKARDAAAAELVRAGGAAMPALTAAVRDTAAGPRAAAARCLGEIGSAVIPSNSRRRPPDATHRRNRL
jgi:hypothetical protein